MPRLNKEDKEIKKEGKSTHVDMFVEGLSLTSKSKGQPEPAPLSFSSYVHPSPDSAASPGPQE